MSWHQQLLQFPDLCSHVSVYSRSDSVISVLDVPSIGLNCKGLKLQVLKLYGLELYGLEVYGIKGAVTSNWYGNVQSAGFPDCIMPVSTLYLINLSQQLGFKCSNSARQHIIQLLQSSTTGAFSLGRKISWLKAFVNRTVYHTVVFYNRNSNEASFP